MSKLAYLKSTKQNLRESVSFANNISQTAFKDKHVDLEKKGISVGFKHSFAHLCHMHDLRLWTITYAPSKRGNLQRLQELHRINNEANYLIANSLYKRVIFGIFLWFAINKLAKSKYLNNGAKDSHEISFRDNTDHL